MAFDLQPTDEQSALRDTLEQFATDVLRPAARDCEAEKATSDSLAQQIHEIGVAAPVAEEFGGGGTLDAVTYCIAAEALAFGDPGIAYSVLGSGMAAIVIDEAGTDEQKARYLPLFTQGPPSTFVAIGEKLAVGDLEHLDTNVDGDKVSGRKYGVLNARDAALGIVVGRTDNGLGAVAIDDGSWEVVNPEDKLGLEAAPTSVVSFDAAGSGIPSGPSLDKAILWSKLMTGAIAVGCARASFEYAAEYATERQAFGKPIGAFQAISFKIADMAIEVDAARMAVWHAAWKLDRGEATIADVAEANGQALATAVRCGDEAVQVLGGHGYIRDHPVEKWFRDAVTLSVFDSPDFVGDAVAARAMVT